MKKLILNFAVLAALFLGFSSCDNDDEGSSGKFTVDGVSHKLSRGYVSLGDTWVTGDDTYYYWEIYLTSSGIQFDDGDGDFVGNGEAVLLDIIAVNDDGVLPSGTYTWGDETADSDGVYVSYNIATEEGDVYDAITNVSVTITKSGSTYKINFTITLDGGDTITGSFSGKVKVIEE